MNGKINLRVPFILKLTFSKMKFHKIRRATSTITKKKTYFDCRSWIFPSLSSTYSSSLFVNEKQSIISLQPVDGIPHNLFICCVTATSSIVKTTLYHAFVRGTSSGWKVFEEVSYVWDWVGLSFTLSFYFGDFSGKDTKDGVLSVDLAVLKTNKNGQQATNNTHSPSSQIWAIHLS